MQILQIPYESAVAEPAYDLRVEMMLQVDFHLIVTFKNIEEYCKLSD